MTVKQIIFKVFMFIILKNVGEGKSSHTIVRSSDIDGNVIVKDNSTELASETSTFTTYLNSSINAVKRMVNALPSPGQIVHYGKQALIGVPQEIVSDTKRFLCSKIIKLNEIVKEYHPESDAVNFEFLTQDQDNVTIPLNDPEYLFNYPKFRMNWNVTLFVSGWNLNQSDDVITALYDAYRCRGGYNFVVLDTSKFVSSMYAWSEFSTEPIGVLIGSAIKNLTRLIPYERIHLIGNGVGAHIAGVAGRHFTKLTGNAIPRITGLDPSRPCVSDSDRSNGLQRGDALFVDIIHSNMAMWRRDPIGDVDFYPNGPNIIQHGCWTTSCSANHAYQFYVKTVYPGNEYIFNATKSESSNVFGMGDCNNATAPIPIGICTPHWARGTFYLKFPLPDLSVPHKRHCNDRD